MQVLWTDLCTQAIAQPNADLGGPGVRLVPLMHHWSSILITLKQIILSIMQQTMIIMAMWLFFTSTQWLRAASHRIRRRSSTATTKRLTAILTPGRQINALIVALQEFQKMQVLFLLALQLVSLISLDHSAWLEAPTPAQVYNNTLFMCFLSTAGIYPIVLGLVTLRKCKGKIEGFILLMSLACIGVSSATWYRSSHVDFSAGQLQESGFSPKECGNANPLRYCMKSGRSLASEGYIESFLIIQWTSVGPICAAIYLAIEAVLPVAIRHDLISVPNWRTRSLQAPRHRLTRISGWVWKIAKAISILFIELWLLLGNALIFQNVYLIWSLPSVYGRVWAIGQVIGVVVWVPAFLEWCYVAIRKSLSSASPWHDSCGG